MDLFRAHVIDVLWIIFTALCFGHTYKLAGLVQDFANAALPNTFILAARRIYTIHNDACDGAHTVIAFTSRLALDQSGKQLPVIHQQTPSFLKAVPLYGYDGDICNYTCTYL